MSSGGSSSGGAGSGVRPTLAVERRLWREGHRWVAGLDEVGRGAWAGPVSVGVAVVHAGCRTRSLPFWLRDSKLLAEERREVVFYEVAAWCADAGVGHASAAECDRWGMAGALRLAACRALACLELPPDAVVVDGPYDLLRAAALPAPDLPVPPVAIPATVVPVVGGDARCAAVAAASVLAKVVRDRLMRADAVHYPAYSFERNKGYPSPAHQTALAGYGLSAIHRRSWSYVDHLPWH
ncbi:MAG: ribonuclease HII [Acidimicrobiales bacterium]